jgi:hypothetical protein
MEPAYWQEPLMRGPQEACTIAEHNPDRVVGEGCLGNPGKLPGTSETVGPAGPTFYLESVMKFQRYCRVLAFAVTGGVLLQAAGCDATSLLGGLSSTLLPLALQLILGGLGT